MEYFQENAVAPIIRELVGLVAEDLRDELTAPTKEKTWCRKWISEKHKGLSTNLLSELRAEDPKAYRRFLRLTPASFDILLSKIGPGISKQATCMRDPLPAETKLEIVLHYLASGSTLMDLESYFRVSKSAISSFMPEVLSEICNKLGPEYMKFPTTNAEWRRKSEEFDSRWNLPGCVGAIDGKHVRINVPPKSGSVFFNYKNFFSMAMMAVVDANYYCYYVSFGSPGSDSDTKIFNSSSLKSWLENGALPDDSFIVGDEAFPLHLYLMRPYPGRRLPIEEMIFNYRLSRARNVIENFFGFLANRFRVLLTPIGLSVETVELIIQSCCILHNFLMKHEMQNYMPQESVDAWSNGTIVNGSWRNDNAELLNFQRGRANAGSRGALARRDALKRFVNNEGAVPWQQSHII